MASTVLNSDVQQRDSRRAVAIAVASHAVFDPEPGDTPASAPYRRGAAFPFLQAIKRVNERLLEKNASETLLFDLVLLSATSGTEQQSRIITSTKHYGLEIGSFCFCDTEDSLETLRDKKVKLFLSTDSADVSKALEKGIAAALLNCHAAPQSTEQLRVAFSGDAVGHPDFSTATLNPEDVSESHSARSARDSVRRFAALVGEMRRRFGVEDSPLSTCLITSVAPRETCIQALKNLRAWGLAVDEAYCLAGAPRGPILSLVKPHVIFTDSMFTS